MYVRSHVDNGRTGKAAIDGAARVQQQLADKLSNLSVAARPALHAVEQVVRRHPGASLVAAAGLGALLAIGLRRWR